MSKLESKNITMSSKTVLRYKSNPQIHYLRGKVFDLYEKKSWKTSSHRETKLNEKITRIFIVTHSEKMALLKKIMLIN